MRKKLHNEKKTYHVRTFTTVSNTVLRRIKTNVNYTDAVTNDYT